MRRRSLLIVLASLAAAASIGGGAARAQATCAEASHPGGEWRLYGHDLQNSRIQPNEKTITPANVGSVVPEHVFSAADAGGQGFFQSTPTIAGGCLYAATDGGNVYALNADTFELVWSASYEVAETRLGGVIAGAVSIEGGRAFVAVSDAGKPFVVALDASTGDELWRTVVDQRKGSFMNASPVPFAGMLFVGFAGDEYVSHARGGYAILDQATGAILAKRYTIPDDAFADGYWGGSIWATGVYHAPSKAIFVGSGNPASHDKEHRFTNSLLKIDVDPESARFGEIVDAYKGNVDQYYPGLDRQPACRLAPGIEYGDAWSLTCLQFDVDFGASPNLFKNDDGELLLGGLQKSGVYHAVYADTMQQAWTAVVGTPCFVCNASSTAAGGGSIFAFGAQPGQVVALDNAFGGYRWVAPVADLFHWQSVSVANRVVYVPDLYGVLNAFDAETGMQVLKRSIGNDVGESVGGVQSGGVAIARNRLYVPAAGYVVAYGLEG